MILADVALLLLIFGIMYKTGSLNSFFPSPADLKIESRLQESRANQGELSIKVLIRNDAGKEIRPGEENSSFDLLSAALRPGPIHSTDFELSDQIELDLAEDTLPDIWEAGRMIAVQIQIPDEERIRAREMMSSSHGMILVLRFRNINRESPVLPSTK